MKARRQIGARHIAWVRGAFRGGQARLRQPVDQPANAEPDGATRDTRARRAAKRRDRREREAVGHQNSMNDSVPVKAVRLMRRARRW